MRPARANHPVQPDDTAALFSFLFFMKFIAKIPSTMTIPITSVKFSGKISINAPAPSRIEVTIVIFVLKYPSTAALSAMIPIIAVMVIRMTSMADGNSNYFSF